MLTAFPSGALEQGPLCPLELTFQAGSDETPLSTSQPFILNESPVQTTPLGSGPGFGQQQVVAKAASNDLWEVGIAVSQGYRPSMEDAYTVDLSLDPQTGLLAVFDGHGGDDCALHCVEHCSKAVKEAPAWSQGNLHATLNQAFLSMDAQICQSCPSGSGTTGTVALLRGGRVVVAGVGDSKAILLREGRIIPMTVDHRPNEPAEEARIRCAGGFVVRGRVNACLNVSRALGDAQFKMDAMRSATQQQVSPEPDIREAHAVSGHDFLLLCSDGVWNSMKETSVLRFVRNRLLQGVPHAQVCEQLAHACLEPCRTAYDNITVILCTFKPAALPSLVTSSARVAHVEHAPSAAAMTSSSMRHSADATMSPTRHLSVHALPKVS